MFKLVYTLTGATRLAYYLAIFIIAVIDVCVLQGLVLLLQDMLPVKPLLAFFTFPKVLAIGTVLFFVNLRLTGLKLLEIADAIKTNYTKILVYAASAVLLLLYCSLVGKLF
ncbi:MAG: hypothetical protein EBZ77_10225 [Chitinophagia bacterium]|nr:hypothetical protein [Chitinophagia bacterium]